MIWEDLNNMNEYTTKNKCILGDSLDKLKELDDNSVDSIVTDPPYGLSAAKNSGNKSTGGFMGKKWDYDVPSVEMWEECLRVLKPGGYLLSFAGTRTQHRMAVIIEDAGFEIRDMIAWVYGSCFPKSHNIGKAIDKMGGVCPNWKPLKYEDAVKKSPYTHNDIDKHLGLKASSCYWSRTDDRACIPLEKYWVKIKEFLQLPDDFSAIKPEAEREVIGKRISNAQDQHKWLGEKYNKHKSNEINITAPATEEAKKWEGWGTALKPALEPITVARKPFKGTVANNVLKWGTGGINIDGCRVETEDNLNGGAYSLNGGRKSLIGDSRTGKAKGMFQDGKTSESNYKQPQGRFPANLIHDGSDEVVELFPDSKGGGFPKKINGNSPISFRTNEEKEERINLNDSGSAARFFYCAKASKKERNEGCEELEHRRHSDRKKEDGVGGDNPRNRTNTLKQNFHPTVKPIKLMQYLVRLVTPKGGTVLDPFAGSGTTGIAAVMSERNYIMIEREKEYFEIMEARIEKVENPTKQWEKFM